MFRGLVLVLCLSLGLEAFAQEASAPSVTNPVVNQAASSVKPPPPAIKLELIPVASKVRALDLFSGEKTEFEPVELTVQEATVTPKFVFDHKMSSVSDYAYKTPHKEPAITPLKPAALKFEKKLVDQPVKYLDDIAKRKMSIKILFARNDCPTTLGLIKSLHEVDKPETDPAKDQELNFYLASCTHKLKLFSESIPNLLAISNSDSPYAKDSIRILFSDLPFGYESTIASQLSFKKVKAAVTDPVLLEEGLYFLAKGKFLLSEHREVLRLISYSDFKNSRVEYDVNLVKTMSLYELGKYKLAVNVLNKIKKNNYSKLEKKQKSLYHIVAARVYYEYGYFKESIKQYEAVGNSHPLWLDSLIEKGWAQLRYGDFQGAIGNMYTLKSNYFQNAYKPEIAIIQSLGLYFLCQYADALDTIEEFKKEFDTDTAVVKNKLKGGSEALYADIYQLLSNSNNTLSAKDKQILIETAKNPSYIRVQKQMNLMKGEEDDIKNIKISLVDLRKKLKSKIGSIGAEQSKMIESKSKGKEFSQTTYKDMKLSAAAKKFELYLVDTSYKALNKHFDDSQAGFQSGYAKLENFAKSHLQESLADIDFSLGKALKNYDLVKFEIYANAGDSIRYMAAGGKVTNKATRNLASEIKKDKRLNWKFTGELWMDEMGKFRTNIPNACSADEKEKN